MYCRATSIAVVEVFVFVVARITNFCTLSNYLYFFFFCVCARVTASNASKCIFAMHISRFVENVWVEKWTGNEWICVIDIFHVDLTEITTYILIKYLMQKIVWGMYSAKDDLYEMYTAWFRASFISNYCIFVHLKS